MAVFAYTLILLLIAFGVHVCLWKVRLPKNHSKTLLAIFLTVLGLGVLSGIVFARKTADPVMRGASDYVQVVAAYIAVMLAYIVTYSGIEVDSPSLVMVLDIHGAGPGGLPQDAFHRQMNNERLVIPRVNDLLKGGLASLENGIYRLTPKGKRIAQVFCFYRRVLGKEHKGG